MGLRGPAPKSAELRVLEGQRAHRPLPAPGSKYAFGVPDQPKGMTAAARRVWDSYVDRMAPLGILRQVDGFSLARLCEDVALLLDLQAGTRKLVAEMKREAKAEGKKLPGGAMISLASSHEGRRLTATVNALASRISRAELQFGLTPAAGARLENSGVGNGGGIMPSAPGACDGIEAALCG